MENKGLLFIRKFIATAMIVVLLLTCAPLGLVPEELTFTSSAIATELKEGFYTYELENGKAVITDVDQTISGNITIPSKLGGYDVVRLDYGAFSYCEQMTSVVIPSTVEIINETVFAGCKNLKTITIPNSVKTIGYKAFMSTKIESITIPASVTDLDSSAFSDCMALKNIYVDSANSKYTSVSGVVFDKDKSTLLSFPAGSDMISYTIPSSVTKVADYAFYYAEKLNSITFSENLVIIGRYAFSYCDLLKKITIPESVKIIGEHAFYDCVNLTEVKLPSTLTAIEAYTFAFCSKLQKIAIPTSVKSIGESAFKYCKLLAFTLHDGLEYIGNGAFYDTYYFDNPAYLDNGVFYYGKYLLDTAYGFSAETYTVKNGTVLIADGAFSYNTKIKKIVIPQTVKIICDYAFAECSNLSQINYPDSLTSIGKKTINNTAYFKNTANWKDDILYVGNHLVGYKNRTYTAYTVKAGTKTIADDAFIESKIATLTIPASVEYIEGNPFDGCYSVQKVIVDSANKNFTAIDGVLFTKDKSKLIYYPEKKATTDYTVPSGVKIIGERAFASTYNLDSIRLADTVQVLETEAFYYSDAITYVFPKSLKYIGRNVLRYYTVNVGYLGNEAQWNKIAIHPENINLAYAKVIFNYVPHTHSYTSKVTKEPNCKESGLRTYTCACGANYSTYIYDYSAHKLDSGKVTKKATYKKTGKKIYVCTICGETVKEEKIPKLTVAKVKGLKAKSIKVESSSSFTLSWSKVSGADKYEVYRQSGKKWKKIGTTTKNSLTVKSLKAGSTYKFKVRAIRTKDKINGAYSDVYSVKIAPSKPSLSLKAGKKQLTASWKKLTGVTGFEVQSSTSNKFTKKTTKTATVKKASATKTTIKKLSKGKKYYVRVRAYKTVSGKKIYGNWSSVKNVKVK